MQRRRLFIISLLFIGSLMFLKACEMFLGIGEKDLQPPTVIISTPKNNSVYSPGAVLVAGIATDNDKIKQISISVDDGTPIQIQNIPLFKKSIDFQAIINIANTGLHKITVKAIDNIGNEGEASVNVFIDKGGPSITINKPVSNGYYSGILSVEGRVSDDSGVDVVEWSLDGINWQTVSSNINQKSFDFSFNIDTTRYGDGLYYIYIRAKDISSIFSLSYTPFFINNVVSNMIISPLPGQPLSGVETLAGTIIINSVSFISNISITVYTNGTIYASSNLPPSINYSYSLDTAPIPSGTEVVFLVKISTYAGISTSNLLTNYVDKSYPWVEVSFPTNGAFLRSYLYSFNGIAGDDTGVSKIMISFDNQNFYRVPIISNNGITNYWSTNINTGLLRDGDNELWVTVYDAGGNAKSTRVLFTVDKYPPVISIASPQNNITLPTNFIIDASASDNYAVKYFVVKLDDTVIVSNTNSASSVYIYKNFITNFSAEGPHILDFIAVDIAGNIGNTTYNIVINQSPASTSNIVIYSLSGTNNYVRGTAIISGTSYDTTAVKDVYYRINNNNWVQIISNANTTSTNWSVTIDTTAFPNGTNTISIKAVDNLEGFTILSTNVVFDNTPPFGSVVSFSNYQVLGGIIDVSVIATDNISLYSVKVQTNGVTATNVSSLPEGTKNKFLTFSWDLIPLSDGSTNSVSVISVDRTYATNTVTTYFIVSNNVPTLIVSNPLPGQYISSNVVVSGMAIKDIDGVGNVEIQLNNLGYVVAQNNVFSPDGYTNWFSHNLSTLPVAEGDQVIKVKAYGSNNTYIEKTIPVIVDRTFPTVSFISPTNGMSYYGNLWISGTASDNFGINYIKLYIKTNGVAISGWDGVNLNLSNNTWSTNWDTTTLPVGYVDIIVEVADYAGNATYATNSVVIRPYIAYLSTTSVYIGGPLTVYGSNFGTGTVLVRFVNDTASGTGANTNVSITIPSNARSGYMLVEVNGIESINSNWVDVWEMANVFALGSAQLNSAFTFVNGKAFFVQSAKAGSTWASNVLISDYTGIFTAYPFFNSNTPNGEIAGSGNTISINGNIMAIGYSPKKHPGGTGSVQVTIYTNNGTSWVFVRTSQIDNYPLAGNDPYIGLKVANDGSIHVAYSDRANGTIKYVVSYDLFATWSYETAVSGLSFDPVLLDAQPKLDVDSNGIPHIVYYDYGIGKLKHAWKVGGIWTNEVVDSIQLNGMYANIYIDPSDTIHVSYYNGDQGDLMYSYKPAGSSWIRETVDYSGITGQRTSIDVYGSEKAISYFSQSYSVGYLAYYNGSSWRIVRIPQPPALSTPFCNYSGVKFQGSDIWVGFVEGDNTLWIAKYRK